jgi:hypothetical protein
MDDRLFDSIGTCGVPAPVGALRYNGSRETGFCQAGKHFCEWPADEREMSA